MIATIRSGLRFFVVAMAIVVSGAAAGPDGSADAARSKPDRSADLQFATFLGGSGPEDGEALAIANRGQIYLAGNTGSANLGAGLGTNNRFAGDQDVFVAKLSRSGRRLLYLTYLGGSGEDDPDGLAIDRAGRAHVMGDTSSADFPTTPDASDSGLDGDSDLFVTILDAAGKIERSTFLGGSGAESGAGLALDRSGRAYVAATTGSSDVPTTPGAADRVLSGERDGYLAKLDRRGDVTHATLIGGSADDDADALALDPSGEVHLSGDTSSPDFPTHPGAVDPTFAGVRDAFVATVDTRLGGLLAATFLGGSAEDLGGGLVSGRDGALFATGATSSSDFPTSADAVDRDLNGTSDAFVARLDRRARTLKASSYLGGEGGELSFGIALDPDGRPSVVGTTGSRDFPTSRWAGRRRLGGASDAFLTRFSSTGRRIRYSTLLGGSDDEDAEAVATDRDGDDVLTGGTESPDFPVSGASADRRFGSPSEAYVLSLSRRSGKR